MNSDTPRTNQNQFDILSELQSGVLKVVTAEFARRLERELSAQIETSKNLNERLKILSYGPFAFAYNNP